MSKLGFRVGVVVELCAGQVVGMLVHQSKREAKCIMEVGSRYFWLFSASGEHM